MWLRVARQDARGVRAGLSGWVGSVDGSGVPGVEQAAGGRVAVAWRVLGEGGSVGAVGGGDGGEMFG